VTDRLATLACCAVVVVTIRAGGQTAAPERFVPSVEIADTTAACEQLTAAALQPDERGFLLRFGRVDSASRVVSAVWDTSGHLRRYSDARGDLRGPDVAVAQRGPRTTIAIDVAKGRALLMNESHGRTLGATMVGVLAAVEN
jgi:hypothetical protein